MIAAISGLLWLRQGSELQTLATAVGQQRTVTLADGSIVALNTNTIVETDLNHRLRQIYLRKGEAHFQVAHDRSRPFLVHAGDAVVRAVGTAFEVRLRTDQHVDIVVNEGQRRGAGHARAAELRGRRRSPVARRGGVRALSAGQELSTATADSRSTAVRSDEAVERARLARGSDHLRR